MKWKDSKFDVSLKVWVLYTMHASTQFRDPFLFFIFDSSLFKLFNCI